jgi:hypothetical protein
MAHNQDLLPLLHVYGMLEKGINVYLNLLNESWCELLHSHFDPGTLAIVVILLAARRLHTEHLP